MINNSELGEGIGKSIRSAATTEEKISLLAKYFKLSDNIVAKAGITDMSILQKDLKTAIKNDLNNGFRTGGANTLGNLSKTASKNIAIKEILERSKVKGLTGKEIDEIINRVAQESKNSLKTAELKIGTNELKAGTEKLKSTTKTTRVKNPGKVKDWIKKHKTATIIGSLAVLGGGGLVAYFATKGENTPEDQSSATELEQILSSFPPCVLKLKDRLEIVTGTDSGTVALLMRQTGVPEYDRAGGIYLYSNGRIILFDNTKRGNYTCKDIESLQESLKMMSIIKNIITEQSSNEISQEQMGNYIDTVVDDLDGWVAVYNLESIKNVLTALKGKTYKGKSALEAFKGFYYRDEKANLIDDINKVGVRTLGVKGMELKDEVVALASGSSAVPSARSSAGGVNDVLNITWDRQGGTGSSAAGGVGRKTVRYRNCKEGRYTKGCYNKTTIPQVQRCLGLDPDGKFWTLTQQALENIGYSNGFTDEDIPKICKTSSQENQRAQIEPMSQPPGTFSQQKPEVDTQNMNLTGKLGV